MAIQVSVKKTEANKKMTWWKQLIWWRVPGDAVVKHRTGFQIRARTLLIWSYWCKTNWASHTRL